MIRKILILIILILPSCNIFDKEERLFNRGFKSFERQDYSSAIKYFSKSIELNNFSYYAFKMRGFVYGLQFKFDSALLDISRAARLNEFLSDEKLEEKFSVCEDFYLTGMMNYYLHNDHNAIEYLKESICFNPMELTYWNKAIEKKISKDFKFEYDIDYTTLYLECLILCGKMCMENNRISEAFYFFYKAKDSFQFKKAPYLMLQKASIKLGDSLGSVAVIKEYEHLIKSINDPNSQNELIKINLRSDSLFQNTRRISYEQDRKKISYGIIQELKNQNPRFDIDSIYSLEH